MKTMKKVVLLMVLSLMGWNITYSQEQITDFLHAAEQGVKQDASVLADAYLKPYGDMLGKTLNGGWYNTAKVHGILGFDLTFGVNMAMVPTSKQTVDMNSLLPKMSDGWSLQNSANNIAPTVAGEMAEANRPVLEYNNVETFTMPNGSGFDKMPMPILQASVGLPFHTDISLRYVPKMSLGDAGKIGLYGFALKHSLKDYIPFVKRLPALQASLLLGYTNLSGEVDVDYMNGDDQKLEIGAGGFTSRLLVGVNIPVLAVYAGMGYGSTNSDFDLTGSYAGLGDDPISLSYKNTGFDFNAGMRIRLGFFSIHGDYTIGDYSMLTAGVGFNFR
ncbi:DUF6588 family protein [Geofilum sp. OHC36d9]|uniref:DUF6588 family protein n=1 Tax=Geofilum sp. OHC36d9 TaxID=3458413 RepID=UPI0040338BFC